MDRTLCSNSTSDRHNICTSLRHASSSRRTSATSLSSSYTSSNCFITEGSSHYEPYTSLEMDEGDFDDLFGGGGSSAGSSSESLTTAAANSMLRESHDISVLADCRPSLHTGYPIASKPPTQCSSPTVKTVEAGDALLQQAHQRPCAKSKASPSEALGSNDDNVQQGVSVIQRIERVFERIADDLQSDAKDIGLTLRVRARPSTSQQLVSGEGACEVKTKHVCFPGKTAAEAWRFG